MKAAAIVPVKRFAAAKQRLSAGIVEAVLAGIARAEAARRAGIPCTIAELPSLGLDLDTPSDLAAFAIAVEAAPGRASRTARALSV